MPLHIPTVSAAPAKVFWAPLIAARYKTGKNIHPAELPQPFTANATYKMPPDFTTLDHLYLVMRSEGTRTFSVVVNLQFGESGETYGAHSEGKGLNILMNLNQIKSYDLVPEFPDLLANLAAGDHLKCIIVHQTATEVHYAGLDGRYS